MAATTADQTRGRRVKTAHVRAARAAGPPASQAAPSRVDGAQLERRRERHGYGVETRGLHPGAGRSEHDAHERQAGERSDRPNREVDGRGQGLTLSHREDKGCGRRHSLRDRRVIHVPSPLGSVGSSPGLGSGCSVRGLGGSGLLGGLELGTIDGRAQGDCPFPQGEGAPHAAEASGPQMGAGGGEGAACGLLLGIERVEVRGGALDLLRHRPAQVRAGHARAAAWAPSRRARVYAATRASRGPR